MNELIILIGYLLLGILVGFIAGAFGIGGGLIMVPSFMFLFTLHNFEPELIPKFAIGTSLFASVLASSSGAFGHLKNRNIDVKIGVLTGLFAVLSGFFLSFVAVKLDAKSLKIIFSFVLLLVTIRLITDQNEKDHDENTQWKYSYYFAPLLGILVGSLSAFAGVGGGIIAVPIFHYFFRMKFKTSIGTSSLMIIFSALSAAVSYIINGLNEQSISYNFTLGYVYLIAAVPVGIGTIISGRKGAQFTHKMNIRPLKILFALLILLIDVKILWDVFG